ncbi:Putative F-box/FBD/LRR-repeat protein At4g03220 [Linum perenne]
MVRRSKRIQNRIDRISDLPDCVLHHILSFLDTKSSVQTCILSRRWRSVWKYVDVLTFSKSSLRSNRALEQSVDKVLSLRCDGSRVRKVRINFQEEQSMHLLERVMKYAASHGVQELFICDHHDRSSDVIASVCSCYQSLKVLELDHISVEQNVGLWSRFELLESLTLTTCSWDFDHVADDAFAANFPRLETLKLDRCFHYDGIRDSVMKITGFKLLNLEIAFPGCRSLEISCPKLQSLSLEYNPDYTLIPDVNLPSLDRANIKLRGQRHVFFSSIGMDYPKLMMLEVYANLFKIYANLFKILHNVQALDLQVETFELLIQTCGSVEHQASPFKRMKFLNLKCCGGSPEVPDQVIHYFLGGSPNEEGKRFTVEKRCFRRNRILDSVLKVTGSKLLNLEMFSPDFDSLEIVPPKLQSFSLKIGRFHYTTLPDVHKLNLPSLNRANIKLLGGSACVFRLY